MLEKVLAQYHKMNQQLKVVFWFTFVGFLQRGISIITTPIFTRVMSTEDYGMFSVFNAYYMVIVIVATLYLHMEVINNAFLKSGESREKTVSVFQSLSLVISSAFFLVAVLFREQLAALMGLPTIAVVVMFFTFIFVEPYHMWVIYKRYQFDYIRPVLTTLFISVATPIAGVIAILTTPGNQGIARIVSYVCMNAILPGACFYVINYRKNHSFYDKALWGYALSFNIPLLAHYLSETLLNQTDRIMINAFLGTSEAGIYSVAYSAASIFTIFSSALNTAFVPWTFQKLKAGDYRSLAKVGYMVLGFLAAVLSVMIMFAPEVVYILAGSQYTGAVYLIPTLGASVFFGYMYQLFSRIELFYEKKAYTVVSTVTAALVNIVLNAWWIPRFGYTAAGYSTLVSHILFCVMHYFFFRKVNRTCMEAVKVYDVKILLLISVLVLVIMAVMTMIYQMLLLRILIAACILFTGFILRKRLFYVVSILREKN